MTTQLATTHPPLQTAEPVLSVRDLDVELDLPTGPAQALCDVTFHINPGEILGVVGESGSGKSLTALSVMGMLPAAGRVTGGEIRFKGSNLLEIPGRQLRALRGKELGIVFQDPLAYLHPQKRVGAQIREALTIHGVPRREAHERAVDLLRLVGIPEPKTRVDAYPHEFSGGMRQRVMIAMAVAHNPALLIADEPTTALDVTVQAEVLKVLVRLREELGTAVMLITHDMGVVQDTCDRVMVMYGGRAVEQGTTDDLMSHPRHPYTRELLRSVPRLDQPALDRLPAIPGQPPDIRHRPAGCPFSDRCPHAIDQCTTAIPELLPVGDSHDAACWRTAEVALLGDADDPAELARTGARHAADGAPVLDVRDVHITYPGTRGLIRRGPGHEAVRGVSLQVHAGRTVGLVGESGCGKSTLARAVLGLQPVTAGTLTVDGKDWRTAGAEEREEMRRTVQMVFQDPYASLNPRMTIADIIAEPLLNHDLEPRARLRAAVRELMDQVGLPTRFEDSYPYQLSGGQRQRVGIARALAVRPRLIVADEPVSALDVSVQAQVINLFHQLREELGVGYLFITHDLAVARQLSDDICVMYAGQIVEHGSAEEIFSSPQHEYTRKLLASAPGQGLHLGADDATGARA